MSATTRSWDPETSPPCAHPNKPGAYSYCGPLNFTSKSDHVFRNDGGRFVDVSDSAGIRAADREGRGLGVVAAHLDDDDRIDLFVVNDRTANYLFRNRGGFRFEEIGAESGVASNAEGNYLAGMGIACGDLDGDGRLDLAVTNFFGESTTFYQNLGGGQFIDRTAAVGLAAPSRYLLGFGVAFFDADNDGWPDLATANGHVNDLRPNVPFAMPAQLLLGGPSGRSGGRVGSSGRRLGGAAAGSRPGRRGRGQRRSGRPDDGVGGRPAGVLPQPGSGRALRRAGAGGCGAGLEPGWGGGAGDRSARAAGDRWSSGSAGGASCRRATAGSTSASGESRTDRMGRGALAVGSNWTGTMAWRRIGRICCARDGRGRARCRAGSGESWPVPEVESSLTVNIVSESARSNPVNQATRRRSRRGISGRIALRADSASPVWLREHRARLRSSAASPAARPRIAAESRFFSCCRSGGSPALHAIPRP